MACSPRTSLIAGIFWSLGLSSAVQAEEAAPDYNRDVRPILSEACFRCHGADEKQRKAKLRLDVREQALAQEALVPGKPEASELFLRLESSDPDEVMPPPDKGEPLSPEEIDVLRRWIEAGAPYAEHWAFVAPSRPELPDPAGDTSPIDQLVGVALAEQGLRPASPAPREVWLRRAYFDLTGLPPSLAEIDAFLADEGGEREAKARVVERLLDASAYGERMAQDWLDLARYADTYGRHEDADCTTWPYRDWVIRAFNENLPYDQFILWQTAGDLLPEPTLDQRIATAFNRLAQQSNEAGSDPEEFRLKQVADRVHTTATAFLGLTMECARCHDHKYDPFTMRDYYALAAYFDNIDELGLFAVFTGGVPTPSLLIHDDENARRLTEIQAELSALEDALESLRPAAEERFERWLESHWPPIKRPPPSGLQKVAAFFRKDPPPTEPATEPVVHLPLESFDDDKAFANLADPSAPGQLRRKVKLVEGAEGQGVRWEGDNYLMIDAEEIDRTDPFSLAVWIKPHQSFDRAVLVHRSRAGLDAAYRGFELLIDQGRIAFALCHFSPGNEIRIRSRREIPVDEWTHITATYDGSSRAKGLTLYVDGVPLEGDEIEVVRDRLYKDIVYREAWGDDELKDGVRLGLTLVGRHNDAGYRDGLMDEFRFYACELTGPEVAQLAGIPDRSPPEAWFEWYLREIDEAWKDGVAAIRAQREEINALSGEAIELMVMEPKPGPPRKTYLLERGEFDRKGAEVAPGTPAALPPLPEGAPRDRRALADWLISADNPLTARVAVNRLWQQFFGRGLVGSSEDFGTQGEIPVHPELLDWLAVHFRDDLGWDVKALCREIVLSDTYGQSSQPADPTTIAHDPENRLLARGPRRRLPAENLRDMALAVSGLLNRQMGGPSVKPYQPAGLWWDSGTQHLYEQDSGDKLYRRSLYTFWRRTLPPPTMTLFDAPTREFCSARRETTSTPLQSLVLMNDPQWIEAGRIYAESLVRQFPDRPDARARSAFRQLTGQVPDDAQVALLVEHYEEALGERQARPALAQDLLENNGERPRDKTLPLEQVAATTDLVRLLFGFSETVMIP